MMISLATTCQNILNVVINGQCFFGKCCNRRLKMVAPMTSSELQYIQEWLLRRHNLFIEFPIDMITMEHILVHLGDDISTVRRRKCSDKVHSYYPTIL